MPRVLISRLSAIGDCLQTLPLVHAIKEHWPTAHITWIVDCGVASILETQPMIDQIVRLPKGFLKRPGALWRLRQSLRWRGRSILSFAACKDIGQLTLAVSGSALSMNIRVSLLTIA